VHWGRPPTKDSFPPQEPDLNDATKAQSDPPSSHDGREKYRSTMPEFDRTMTDVYADELYSSSFHITLARSTLTPPPTTKTDHHHESILSSLGAAGPASPYTASSSNSQVVEGLYHDFRDFQNPPLEPLIPVHIPSQEHFLAPQYSKFGYTMGANVSLPTSTPAPAMVRSPQNDVFAQRLQATNNQHLSTLKNQTRLEIQAREQPPFRQGSTLAPTGNSLEVKSKFRFGTATQEDVDGSSSEFPVHKKAITRGVSFQE
jgi:hypothetical protein